ncbi:trypsin-1-like [Penaeus japonicus]|uniref:trypsin-1-like n=1 Tax=Penaeus japonicus TaxID=27405 RepID=UPI001C70BEAA|nr:trypsin-1-like [Penaeus japonicus]
MVIAGLTPSRIPLSSFFCWCVELLLRWRLRVSHADRPPRTNAQRHEDCGRCGGRKNEDLMARSVQCCGDNRPFCGGSVYNSEWVVTSAYCIYGSSAYELEILYNMWDWTDSSVTQVVTRSVAEIIMHPQSDYLKVDNDIALIRVSSAVDLTLPGIMPVCLPSSTDNYADQIGIVTGWGTLTYYGSLTNKSKEVKVPIRSQAECASSLSANYNTSIMICAGLGNDNACQVDWGGPLTVDVNGQHHLAGIVTQDIGCAPSRPYGVFTNVPYYVAFIENNANTGTFC